MLSPDGLQSPKTTGGLDVSNNTNADDGRGLNDGTSLHNLLLVDLGSGSVDLTDNVSHTRLVAHKAGQVDGLARVILGEALDLTPVPLGPLLGQEALGAMSWRLEFSVRLRKSLSVWSMRLN